MEPSEWRERVGVHIEERRRALFPSRRAAVLDSGISEVWWRQIETGERQLAVGIVVAPNPSRATRERLCERLRWRSDGIERLLRGEPPVELEPEGEDAPATGSVETRLAALESGFDDLRGQLNEIRRTILDLPRFPDRSEDVHREGGGSP